MKSVCVIGLGLIGGSIVRDIKLKKLAETVYAYDKNAKSLEKAKAAGWIDFAINEFNDIKDIKPDFIIVATPCLLYTSPSPRDKRQSRMPSSA